MCKNIKYKSIILHVPHSSSDFSFAGKEQAARFGHEWLARARDLIDWYTDELFVPESCPGNIIPVVFDTCRTLCDVERMSHDPLEAKGLGIVYYSCLATHIGECSRRHSSATNISTLQKYLDHQYKLAGLLVQNCGSLLLDCHSFSNGPTLLQPDASKSAGVDICLGWNEDFTRPSDEVLHLVGEYFSHLGYAVALNTPFSNSKTVDTPADYSSLMIEVNKRLYMDEKTLKKTERFARLQADLQGLYELLLD